MIQAALQNPRQRAAGFPARAGLRRALAVAAVLAVLAGCAAPPASPPTPEVAPPVAVPKAPASSETPGKVVAPAQERPRRRAGASSPSLAAPRPEAELEAELEAESAPSPALAEEGGATAADGVLVGRGVASWYGPQFHGRRTASGERFDRNEYTAAHRTLPFGSRVCVRSAITGKTVVVRINDRGPFAPGRVIDLSQAAAEELGMLGLGLKPVELWHLASGDDSCPDMPDDAASEAPPQPSAAPTARTPAPSKARSSAKPGARKRRR